MIFFIDMRGGPTLGDLMDMDRTGWLICLVVVAIILTPVFWFTYDQNEKFRCMNAAYPLSWSDERSRVFIDREYCYQKGLSMGVEWSYK